MDKFETISFMGGVILQVDHDLKTCTIRFDTKAPRQYYGRDSVRRYINAARECAAYKYPDYEIIEHTNAWLYGRPGEDD